MKVSCNFDLKLCGYIYQVAVCARREMTQPCFAKHASCSMGSQAPTLPVHSAQDGTLGALLHPRG